MKLLRYLLLILGGLLILALVATGWIYFQMRGSLAQLDGRANVSGLHADVEVNRDALGVPTITGSGRIDIARALGWLHGQERFFQMDLLRRRASGELSELFGPKAIEADKSARLHGFRRNAQENLARLKSTERELIEAYTEGVNAGRLALGKAPFEYALLRAEPREWLAEDSILVAFAMAMELHEVGTYERSLSVLRLMYGQTVTDFFAPLLTDADAAMDDTRGEEIPVVPSAEVINLRQVGDVAGTETSARPDPVRSGSNSFALSGEHTASGVPLLANDMHLFLRAPNMWYRASLEWTDETTAAHQVTGVTLPGIPLIVAGSNGKIAWGFTNAYADIGDVVVIEPNVISRSFYKDGVKLVRFELRHELIKVRGEESVDFVVNWTRWGPVIGEGDKTRPLAYRWTAHLPDAMSLSLLGLETATNVAEALPIAQDAGMPAQNIIVVDQAGHMAWSIAGQLPRRVGYDGRFPVSRTYGDRYWDGVLTAEEKPALINPASGRLWTANNRILGGEALNLLGDGGYDKPARAARIRDRLFAMENATPADMLSLQLDDHAPSLDRWHDLLLATLTPVVVEADRSLAKLREHLSDWESRARIDSASYPLVKYFRAQVAQRVFDPLFVYCVLKFEGFNWRHFQYEQPLWTLIEQQPLHLLSPEYDSWESLLVASARGVVEQLDQEGTSISRVTWGKLNRAKIRHPLARIFPDWLTGWLSMPSDPLPGDANTPRVQSPGFGASERMVVSPGREEEGLFHMPTGQSGNPLSPYFRAGHEAWVRGDPTPFLPGVTEHTLILQPE